MDLEKNITLLGNQRWDSLMKKNTWLFAALSLTFLLTSCHNNSSTVWEDTKTMGRYLHRKGQLLWKQDADSKMVESTDEFTGPQEEEYIPLKDEDLKKQFADMSIPQPKEVPGAIGSSVPSIDQFAKPASHLANLFQNLYFNTDEHVLRSKDYYSNISNIAIHMKKNSNMYIFVAGHCDERASEAYNFSTRDASRKYRPQPPRQAWGKPQPYLHHFLWQRNAS